MTVPDIDLTKLAGAAGSAVGLIISTAILLSWLTARYTPAFSQYRALTAELRGRQEHNRRHKAIVSQIEQYRRRLRYMSRATCLLCWGMGLTTLTVLLAGVASIVGRSPAVAIAGGLTLFASLAMDLVATGWMLAENRVDRKAIEAEAADISEVGGDQPPDDNGNAKKGRVGDRPAGAGSVS